MNIEFSAETDHQLPAVAQAEGAPVGEDATKLIRENLEARRFDTSPQVPDRNRMSAFGKYAHVPGGSEAFAREKQAAIVREDRPRR